MEKEKQCYACGTTFSYTEKDLIKSLIEENVIEKTVVCPCCGRPIKIN